MKIAKSSLADTGIEEPGLNRVIRSWLRTTYSSDLLFTAGVKEVRAWTIPGATAPCRRQDPHRRLEKGFIRAEVVGYEHFIEFGGESGAKMQVNGVLKGKEYIVKDGDVVFTSVSNV